MKHLLSFIIVTAFITGCGGSPTPPTPVPPPPEVTKFEVVGKKIVVKGEMKPGHKASLAEAKAAVATAVKQLDSKNKL